MDTLKALLHALWQQDFETLSDPHLVWTIYLLVLIILFLENGIIPAAFLPGDSLLVLLGLLISKGALHFPLLLFLLTVAASFGSWISYLQGKWLGHNKIVKSWLENLPIYYQRRAYQMFHRHGLSALLIGRFIAFVRTLLPTIAGLSGLKSSRFHFFNWISSFFWVLTLTLIGFTIGSMPFLKRYEEGLILCFMLLPAILLIIGLVSSLVLFWRRRRLIKSAKKS